MRLTTLGLLLLTVVFASALPAPAGLPSADPKVGLANFTQFKSHDDLSLGTFQQQYAYSTDFWNGPGSPIIFATPGEEVLIDSSISKLNITSQEYAQLSYFTVNQTVMVLAQEIGAAVVQLEHRFWGQSIVFDTVNTTTLQYLTVQQAIADFVYFAENVEFPFDPDCTSKASQVPWVFIGASYSGALPAWTSATSPGTFWAYWASSAPVQAIEDFWYYQVPIERHMPQNCSSDLQLVAAHIDQVLTTGTTQDVFDLKSQFNAANQSDDAFLINTFLQLITWQYADLSSDQFGAYALCDNVENVFNASSPIPGPEGVGVEKALDGFARNLQSPGFQQALAIQNGAGNLWYWIVCNEPLHWWQSGAPEDQPSLLPRTFTIEASQHTQCDLLFPPDPHTGATYDQADLTVDDYNRWTGGWNLNSNYMRTLFVNNEFDPYREATVSSDFRPGGPLQSTDQVKVSVVPGATHGGDLNYLNALVNAGAKAVVDANIQQMAQWVAEFPKGGK